jgi:hypothetical protein
MEKQVHCYLVTYLDGSEIVIWAHHHEVLANGAVSFYNKVEFESQPPLFRFWKTIAHGQWKDFDELVEAKVDVPVLGSPPRAIKSAKARVQ